MTQTLTLPADLVADLEKRAKAKGLASVEEYLRRWQRRQARRERDRQAIERIEKLQARLSAKYGMMSDSVPLIRENRER